MNTTGSPCNIPELFGCMVFNESTMQQRLSPTVYAAWKQVEVRGEDSTTGLPSVRSTSMK